MQFKIIPCVCIEHEPDYTEDSNFNGMPQLTVYSSSVSSTLYYSAFCPKCGRGSKYGDFKSVKSALKHWNEIQTNLVKYEERIEF